MPSNRVGPVLGSPPVRIAVAHLVGWIVGGARDTLGVRCTTVDLGPPQRPTYPAMGLMDARQRRSLRDVLAMQHPGDRWVARL